MLSSLINRMIILRRLLPTGNKDLKENKDGTHRNNGKKNGSGAGTSNNNSQDALN